MVERATHNGLVTGSSPVRPTIDYNLTLGRVVKLVDTLSLSLSAISVRVRVPSRPPVFLPVVQRIVYNRLLSDRSGVRIPPGRPSLTTALL